MNTGYINVKKALRMVPGNYEAVSTFTIKLIKVNLYHLCIANIRIILCRVRTKTLGHPYLRAPHPKIQPNSDRKYSGKENCIVSKHACFFFFLSHYSLNNTVKQLLS
jgi:hypothetical protein